MAFALVSWPRVLHPQRNIGSDILFIVSAEASLSTLCWLFARETTSLLILTVSKEPGLTAIAIRRLGLCCYLNRIL
ncbi:hypothetical protein [Phyllobacterium endophyticum]|uniref:hypothetical protein n=1 Tax=Phyllobacterium endophyticum TaxID=1149773 RepID=UPI0011CB7118|nr:hypothetical protein [Phyllobacterium endophyticum]TXR46339.1 hypothetical protein FVA77_25615 [Phyllobacterium endophyticum]